VWVVTVWVQGIVGSGQGVKEINVLRMWLTEVCGWFARLSSGEHVSLAEVCSLLLSSSVLLCRSVN
jgi:hypothetical protein